MNFGLKSIHFLTVLAALMVAPAVFAQCSGPHDCKSELPNRPVASIGDIVLQKGADWLWKHHSEYLHSLKKAFQELASLEATNPTDGIYKQRHDLFEKQIDRNKELRNRGVRMIAVREAAELAFPNDEKKRNAFITAYQLHQGPSSDSLTSLGSAGRVPGELKGLLNPPRRGDRAF